MVDTIRYAIDLLFKFLEYAIFIEVLLSWLYQGKENKFTAILHIFTDPFMGPARKLQNSLMPGLMIDLSPIGAFFILSILRTFVYSILRLLS